MVISNSGWLVFVELLTVDLLIFQSWMVSF